VIRTKPLTRKTPLKPGTKGLKRTKPLRSRGKKKPTKAESAHIDAIKARSCVIAYLLGMRKVPCEAHHLTEGSKHGARRLGHMQTVGLNPYSHRGVPFGNWSIEKCRATFGPSLANEPKAFREKYPDELLLQAQEELLALPIEDEAA